MNTAAEAHGSRRSLPGGWRLLDSALIGEVARRMHAAPEFVREFYETVDPWLHRLSRRALWHGAFEGAVAVPEPEFLDAETMSKLSRALIEEAADMGIA